MKLIASALALLAISGFALAQNSAAAGPPLPPHPLDDCADAAPLVTGPNPIDTDGSTFGSAAATTTDSGGCYTLYNNAWYSFTAARDGEVAMIFCDEVGSDSATFDTRLQIWDACGGTLLACNDDMCGFGSGVRFASTAGSTYLVEVGGRDSAELGTGPLIVIELTGTAFCNANGVAATPCPCGNNNDDFMLESGCANSASQGAILLAEGAPTVAGDDLSLVAVRLVPGLPMVFFQGENAIAGGMGVTFGDGLRCVGLSVIRLIVLSSDPDGQANSHHSGLDVAAEGEVTAGDTRHYQAWYREGMAGGPCGNSHNLTNGVTITWEP